MFLLDTHALLWSSTNDRRLPLIWREAMVSDVALFLSAASVWEIEIKRALGKLSAPDDYLERAEATGIEVISIEPSHAVIAAHLPFIHRDPFDRMLVAQAQSEGLTILTADRSIKAYDVPTL